MTYGISHTDVFVSVWSVVEAINQVKEFFILYPGSHDKQQKIAANFLALSQAGFENCAGAIDGIHKPTRQESEKCGIGQLEFFYGWKNKFGLNCQAVSDDNGRFLGMAITYSGSTSDCLAFEGSNLYKRIERGLLLDGFCLFGDNAYLNSQYMATPNKNVSNGSRDSYNYYHSQLRICVECAFGMFTNCWSILRAPLPIGLYIMRSIALVNALADLHNLCINRRDNAVSISPCDRYNMFTNPNGYVPLEDDECTNIHLPAQMMGGGYHFDDVNRGFRQNQMQRDLP